MIGTKVRTSAGADATVQGVEADNITLAFGGGSRRTFQFHELGPITIVDVPESLLHPAARHATARRACRDSELRFQALIEWTISRAPNAAAPTCLSSSTLCLGRGPIATEGLRSVVADVGGRVAGSFRDVELLVLGRTDWQVEDVQELLRARSGQSLRVYSQEMYLAMIATRADPVECPSPELVREMGGDHHGLKFLLNIADFDWATSVVKSGCGQETFDFSLPKYGYLTFEGYCVGLSGKAALERRNILRYCFLKGSIPHFYPSYYRNEWGTPGNSVRLDKIKRSLATFARKAQMQGVFGGPQAIADWSSDLAWLEEQGFEGT